MNILLGVTGSVASVLTPPLVARLSQIGTVEVVTTKSAQYFWRAEQIPVRTWTDRDEWVGAAYQSGQPIPHIELRKWADVLVIAPLSADTLAKLADGRADNLLTSIVRAWDLNKPIVIAPAMNTLMWMHPATEQHLATLRGWYGDRLHLVSPISKKLACGDEGVGAMAAIDSIAAAVRDLFSAL